MSKASKARSNARRLVGDANALGITNRRRQDLGNAAADMRRAMKGGSGRVTPKSQHSRRAR
jgi:hypothetical protein